MLSYQEMVAITDRHYNGRFVDVVGVRQELAYQWALDESQVQRIIWDMIDAGLV